MLPAFFWGMSPKSLFVAVLMLPVALLAQEKEKPKISALERSQGWRLLDTSDLRAFGGNKLPKNWQYKKAEGIFVGATGTALVTAEEFGDFELSFDCKVATGGHAEVYVRSSEEQDAPEKSGAVVLLSGHGESVGGNGLAEPDRKLKPRFDEWYRVKIALFGNEVRCWINGDQVNSYMLGSSDWLKAVAASAQPGVAKAAHERTGRMAFSGDGVEIRNVKVRAM